MFCQIYPRCAVTVTVQSARKTDRSSQYLGRALLFAGIFYCGRMYEAHGFLAVLSEGLLQAQLLGQLTAHGVGNLRLANKAVCGAIDVH